MAKTKTQKTKPIQKILIANRGEIACRIMRTANRMGIATVAVYSDADKHALHVKRADEAVHIGPSPAAESYLVIDKIIKAAKQTGADAIHPGYGFLSENPEFVRACKKAKIIFIGPSAESREAMGLNDAAKKLMEQAGVPVTPGYHGQDQAEALLAAKAGMIGYPVLIKAVAGGGGKGMRKVESADAFSDALAAARREAKAAFGDDRVLIEKYIASPRHIEVQVFGDTHGNVIHLFERDCSLQRRHQKVIEEAPAPGMSDAVRDAMCAAAIKAAKAVNYVGAGTVEFIVDGSGPLRPNGFWFMEMNTRLQVEHPVTELITDRDLVEMQIRVARGETLPSQDEIRMIGHAMEARLYAEDPAHDFLPATGHVYCMNAGNWTNGHDVYRTDTGVEDGDAVSIYYDPMIAKLIVLARNREYAAENLQYLVDRIQVAGLTNNAAFLYRCLGHQDFIDGNISTHFINDHLDALIPPDFSKYDEVYGLAALYLAQKYSESPRSPFRDTDGWRANLPRHAVYYFRRGGVPLPVTVLSHTERIVRIRVGDGPPISFNYDGENEYAPNEATLNQFKAWAYRRFDGYVSLYRNGQFVRADLDVYDGLDTALAENALVAPMPGKIIKVHVNTGDKVKAGDKLIVMEAMKMEMALEAPADGVVSAIAYQDGDLVNDGETLLEIDFDTETQS